MTALQTNEPKKYLEKYKWSVIPVEKGGKKPLNGWKKYQNKLATLDELIEWQTKFGDANFGICTGRVSELCVVDIDNELGQAVMMIYGVDEMDTPIAKTGKGYHYYFKYVGIEKGRTVHYYDGLGKRQNLIEFKATGQFVVAPPSLHPSGNRYEWVAEHSPEDMDLQPMPKWLANLFVRARDPIHERVVGTLTDLYIAGDGNRNEQLNKTAYILGGLVKRDYLEEANVVSVLLHLSRIIGLGAKESHDTIKSGFEAGLRSEKQTELGEKRNTKDLDQMREDLSSIADFKRNLLVDKVEVNGRIRTEFDDSNIQIEMAALGYKNRAMIMDMVNVIAANNPYHPVQDYLNGLSWDGETDYIGQLASHFQCGRDLPDDPVFHPYANMFHLAFKNWLLGAILRVFTGKHHPVMVFEGGQGIGKSYFTNWLAKGIGSEFFVEAPITTDYNTKDQEVMLIRKFIWEIGELGSTTRKADQGRLKGFLSKEDVDVRQAYAKNSLNKKALASFIGTVNDEGAGYLFDTTGGRRFFLVPVEKIDWGYDVLMTPDQLWGQAMELYLRGERANWGPEVNKLQVQINKENTVQDGYDLMLEKHFDISDPNNRDYYMYTQDILDKLHDLGFPRVGHANRMLSGSMKKLGYKATRIYDKDGTQLRGYYGIRLKKKDKKITLSMDGALWENQL